MVRVRVGVRSLSSEASLPNWRFKTDVIRDSNAKPWRSKPKTPGRVKGLGLET